MTATRIDNHLYQGSAPPIGPGLAQNQFSAVVLCALELQYPDKFFPGAKVIHAPLDDAELTAHEWQVANKAADEAAAFVRAGKRVLITCQQGRNRSGLVMGLTLHRVRGWSGHRIVDHIRDLRENALTNVTFAAALRSLPQISSNVTPPAG